MPTSWSVFRRPREEGAPWEFFREVEADTRGGVMAALLDEEVRSWSGGEWEYGVTENGGPPAEEDPVRRWARRHAG